MTLAIDQLLVRSESTLRQALEVIDRFAHGICFVVSDEGKLVGLLTDGDARRALLKGVQLTAPVREMPLLEGRGKERHEVDWKISSLRAGDFRIELRRCVGTGDGADQWDGAGSNRSGLAGRRGECDANRDGRPAQRGQ